MSRTLDFTPKKQAARTARNERLARALRDNLRRRKDQSRAREDRVAAPPEASPSSDPPR
jgi:hypothetical protein